MGGVGEGMGRCRGGGRGRTHHLGGVVAAGNVGLLEEGAQGCLWGTSCQLRPTRDTKGGGKSRTPPHPQKLTPQPPPQKLRPPRDRPGWHLRGVPDPARPRGCPSPDPPGIVSPAHSGAPHGRGDTPNPVFTSLTPLPAAPPSPERSGREGPGCWAAARVTARV